MLYELVCLPQRCSTDYTVSTEVMMFSDINTQHYDNPSIYGCTVDGGYSLLCGTLNKYKSIELFDGKVIERLLVSEEPIETTKKWWTSDQRAIVLQSKIYYDNKAYVLKNVWGLLACGSYDLIDKRPYPPEILFNIYTDFLGNILTESGLDRNTPKMFPYLIPDADLELIKVVQQCDFNWNNFNRRGFELNDCKLFYGGIGIVPPQAVNCFIEPETKLNIFSKYIKMPNIVSGEYQNHSDNIKPTFNPDEVNFISSVGYNWGLLELLYKLNSSHYTDIKIEYNVRFDNIPRIYGTSVYKNTGNKGTDMFLARLFKDWVYDIVKSCIMPVDKAVLTKTWAEEVFIELHCQNNVRRYYFDMIPVIIGTIALQ